jgi:hypothetical protein
VGWGSSSSDIVSTYQELSSKLQYYKKRKKISIMKETFLRRMSINSKQLKKYRYSNF